MLLVNINHFITEGKWKEAKHWFQTKHRTRQQTYRARYISRLDTERPDTGVLSEDARIAHRYLQLKSQHLVTGTFFRRIEKRNSDRCWDCTFQTRMKVYYVMYNCQTWRNHTQKMLTTCKKRMGNRFITVRQLIG